MTQFLRRTAGAGLSLPLAALIALAGMTVGTAHAQDGTVSVGGVVEAIGGTSDNDNGVEGISRGLFSRIIVNYDNTLDNGLTVAGNISYQLNQRGVGGPNPPAENLTAYAPDILSLSVGGAFGTISVGAHAPASCALLPRPIAFVPGGVNTTWYSLFTGITDSDGQGASMNVVFSETNYCGTSESVSYSIPSVGGLSAMVTYAPNMGATQGTTVRNASADSANMPDYINIAGTYSADMGGASVSVGAAMQTSGTADNGGEIDSQSIAGTVGMGGATLGAAWFDNGDVSGQTIGAKYALGHITPAFTYSTQERDSDGAEETALVVGANYAMGGGLSVFLEYMDFEHEASGSTQSDTLLMSGIVVAF